MNGAFEFITLTYLEQHGPSHRPVEGYRVMLQHLVGWMPRDKGGSWIQTTGKEDCEVAESCEQIDEMIRRGL